MQSLEDAVMRSLGGNHWKENWGWVGFRYIVSMWNFQRINNRKITANKHSLKTLKGRGEWVVVLWALWGPTLNHGSQYWGDWFPERSLVGLPKCSILHHKNIFYCGYNKRMYFWIYRNWKNGNGKNTITDFALKKHICFEFSRIVAISHTSYSWFPYISILHNHMAIIRRHLPWCININ